MLHWAAAPGQHRRWAGVPGGWQTDPVDTRDAGAAGSQWLLQLAQCGACVCVQPRGPLRTSANSHVLTGHSSEHCCSTCSATCKGIVNCWHHAWGVGAEDKASCSILQGSLRLSVMTVVATQETTARVHDDG